MKYFSPVFLTTFFFVSGYLFKEKCSFSKVFEQRTRTLLLPFLSLGLVMILLSQILTFNDKAPLLDEIEGLIFQNGKNELLWFVAALYIYSIIFYWVERMACTTKMLFLVSVSLFILDGLLYLPKLPWHINSFGYACFYMGLGKCYKEKEQQIHQVVENEWFVLACFLIYIWLITSFDMHISFGKGYYIIDAWAVTIPGLIVLLYVSKHVLYRSRLLLFVGSNTLFYFAFHGKVYSLLQVICHKAVDASLLASDSIRLVVSFAIVVLDALILIIPAIFVNRYFSFLLGKGFKLWKAA